MRQQFAGPPFTTTLDVIIIVETSTKSNQTGRFFVFVLMVAFYALTAIVYFQEPSGLSPLVYGLGAADIVFTLIFLVASDGMCDATAHIVILGIWS